MRSRSAYLLEEVGPGREHVEAVPDEVPGGLVAGDDEEHRLRADGLVGEVLAVDIGVDEAGDDVVGRLVHRAVVVDQALHEPRELGMGIRQRPGTARVLRLQELVGPHAEPVLVLGRDAEHVRDHDRRERVEHVDEIDGARLGAVDGPRHQLAPVRG